MSVGSKIRWFYFRRVRGKDCWQRKDVTTGRVNERIKSAEMSSALKHGGFKPPLSTFTRLKKTALDQYDPMQRDSFRNFKNESIVFEKINELQIWILLKKLKV